MTELWKSGQSSVAGGGVHAWTCGHMVTTWDVGVASAHLRTGTLWWYQTRGRQGKFFRKYIVFA